MKILLLVKAYPHLNLEYVESTIQIKNEGVHYEKITYEVIGLNKKFISEEHKLEYGKF